MSPSVSNLEETTQDAGRDADVFLGRQAIFDDHLETVAYELLFRSNSDNHAVITDGGRATARVFSSAFMELGLDRVIGRKSAFVNMTRDFVMGEFARLFPQDRVFLEVLEDVLVDASLLDRIDQLRREGYRIALDDFVYRDELAPLVERAQIVKIDFRALSRQEIQDQVARMKRFEVSFLAEKVETEDELHFARACGFTYFQGYFLARPQVMQGRRSPGDRMSSLRLLARINDPKVELEDLASIISTDVVLSYKLLRYINSAFFALGTKVASIKSALAFLGLRMTRSWVNLVVLAGVVDKSHEVLTIGMIRAKIAEHLAGISKKARPDAAFTVGLFSVLDVLLVRPMGEILKELPLEQEIVDALERRDGELGRLLNLVEAFERGDWRVTDAAGIAPGEGQRCWVEALKWLEMIQTGLA